MAAETLLFSDLHLSPTRPETTDRLLRFLAGPARSAGEIYILGDLFDYWVGDDDLDDPLNRQVCAALAALPAVKAFLPGNRDFLVGSDFAAAAGLELLPDQVVRPIGGQPTLLLHGDTLCIDDHPYQAFRAKVRTAAWRQETLARPLAERRRQIEALRASSEEEKQMKSEAIMDVNPGAVASAFRGHGVERMIHGHIHRQAVHEVQVDGKHCRRWVLGEWYATGNALAFAGDGWRWLEIL